VDRAGVQLIPFKNKPPEKDAYLDVGALTNQPSEVDRERLRSLDEILDTSLEGLRRYWKVEDLTVLEKKNITLQGFPAIVSKIRYRSHDNGVVWVEKSYTFSTPDGLVFEVQLKCLPEDFSQLEPITDAIAERTLEVKCGSKSKPKSSESRQGEKE
jgi:hypothetical protein